MKPKLIIFYFLLFTFNFLLEATATVRYVSKTGTSTPPYTSWASASDSIQKCINICQNGDTVYVANGVYKETLIVNKQIALMGSSMDSTIIDGRQLLNNFTVEFVADGSIENFNIIGKGKEVSASYCLISFENNVIVRNCKINNSYSGTGFGDSSPNLNNLIIKEVNRAFISECSMDTCHQVITNSIIISSSDLWSNSVYFSFGGSPLIVNNIIISTQGIVFTGIEVDAFIKPIIYNNLVLGFDDQNIGSHNSTLASILTNNIASYSNDAGIKLNNGARAKLRNNIVSSNVKGVSILNGVPDSDYNLFWENNTNLLGLSYGDSDIVANPMFVKDTLPNSSLNFDYHLQKYSPAIDKGDPNILDIDGSRSDIGLFGGPLGQIYTYHDLAPKPPRNLTASVQGKAVTLKWNKNTEADIFRYRIYRDTVPNFIYDTTKIIGVTADTFFVDMLGKQQDPKKYYYKLTAIDSAINQSAASEEVLVIITGMAEVPPIVVEEYKLLQNYPNPFNPSTTIPYRLKSSGYVKVMVYNVLGELVRVLVNHHQATGYYEIDFTPNSREITRGREAIREFETFYYGDIVSGIYLYRIEVIGEGNIPVFTEMKKMMMVK